MKIEIKKSTKPVEYKEAIDFLQKRLPSSYREGHPTRPRISEKTKQEVYSV